MRVASGKCGRLGGIHEADVLSPALPEFSRQSSPGNAVHKRTVVNVRLYQAILVSRYRLEICGDPGHAG
jgi:hypothetical protein